MTEKMFNEFKYEINDGKVTITGVTKDLAGDVIIPNEIEGYPVTKIADKAFYDCTNLTGINIPDSVTSIGYEAFACCESLANINIPNNLTSISDLAFVCTNLKKIVIDKNNKFFMCDENGVLFNKDKTILIAYPVGKEEEEYIIPDSVISIKSGAFSGCSSIINITIPNSVTEIGCEAFAFCEKITKIHLPNNITSIRNHAFYRCSSLENITIPNNVTSIEDWAFSECESLASITIPDSVTSIGYYAIYDTFDDCESLENIYYAGDAESWKNLKVELPETVTVHFGK